MALNFGVKNSKFDIAYEKLKKDRESNPSLYWERVEKSIEEEAKNSSESIKNQEVDADLMKISCSL